MQYDLTEEQRMLQDMVRRLAKEKVEPGAAKRDVDGEFDWEMVELMRENGLYGIDFDETYDGSGAGLLALAIAVEELSKVDGACGLLLADHELGSLPIMLAATLHYYFIAQDREITLWEGWLMIIFYILFIGKTVGLI